AKNLHQHLDQMLKHQPVRVITCPVKKYIVIHPSRLNKGRALVHLLQDFGAAASSSSTAFNSNSTTAIPLSASAPSLISLPATLLSNSNLSAASDTPGATPVEGGREGGGVAGGGGLGGGGEGLDLDFVLVVGDERTDEDMFDVLQGSTAFAVLRSHHIAKFVPGAPSRGHCFTVTVGRKISRAQYFLDDPKEVRRMLELLAERSTGMNTSIKAEGEEQISILIQRSHQEEKTEDVNQLPTSSSSNNSPPPPQGAHISAATPNIAVASSPSASHKRRRSDVSGEDGSTRRRSLRGKRKKKRPPGNMTTNGTQEQQRVGNGGRAAASLSATVLDGLAKDEVLSLILQALEGLGYDKTAQALHQEAEEHSSSFSPSLHSSLLAQRQIYATLRARLEKGIDEGRWEEVEKEVLPLLPFSTTTAAAAAAAADAASSSEGRGREQQQQQLEQARFLLLRQQYLELIDEAASSSSSAASSSSASSSSSTIDPLTAALTLLQTRLTPCCLALRAPPSLLHSFSLLLLLLPLTLPPSSSSLPAPPEPLKGNGKGRRKSKTTSSNSRNSNGNNNSNSSNGKSSSSGSLPCALPPSLPPSLPPLASLCGWRGKEEERRKLLW
ncbi:hypothetical protein VYU27_010054, partial [Nannochloropsis oceanica]